jgi:hypothetical protein
MWQAGCRAFDGCGITLTYARGNNGCRRECDPPKFLYFWDELETHQLRQGSAPDLRPFIKAAL